MKKSHEYRVMADVTAEQLEAMDVDGWKREHIQFRPDGKLDVVFSRAKRVEKPAPAPVVKAVTPVVFPPIGGDDVLDARVGLFDDKLADGMVPVSKLKVIRPRPDKVQAILDAFNPDERLVEGQRKIAEAALEAANEFWAQWQADNPVIPFSEKVGA